MIPRNTLRHNSPKKPHVSAGDIQVRVDLQLLARQFLGDGMPGGQCVTYFNPFDPDDCTGTFHVFPSYYRDARTGSRGGAIKFIQRMRRCSYDQAIAYLQGWLDREQIGNLSPKALF